MLAWSGGEPWPNVLSLIATILVLIAFYFAVISLASSLFFNQVEAWHVPVRSFQTSLKELKEVEQWRRADEQRKPIEAAAPNLFAALVGLLVAGLTLLAFLVRSPATRRLTPSCSYVCRWYSS